jgi:hypothetical protein
MGQPEDERHEPKRVEIGKGSVPIPVENLKAYSPEKA